jgi:DNA-binding CsgD family transcriptional regulator
MPGQALNRLQIAADVARIASTPASVQERAEALLEPLSQVVPYSGVWISLLDPELREQPPLVCQGYPDALVRYMSGSGGVAEIEQIGLHRSPGAIRTNDLAIPLAEIASWAEYLEPAGFRGGLAAALFTPDGRYLGVLGLNTDSDAHPTRAARDLITMIGPTIASAIDPMRLVSEVARTIRDAQAAVVLTRAGNSLPLPGMPGHPLLQQGSPVLPIAAAILAAHKDAATFLCPYLTGDTEGEVRVTVLDFAKNRPYYLTGAVVVSAPGDLHGLDRTELRIVGSLIADWSIPRIATALALDERAVGAALASIQDKLGAPTVAIAAMRALRQGVYIPVALAQSDIDSA